jgi:hypothetical protein
MTIDTSLHSLESDVLARIRAHRQHGHPRAALPLGVVVTACALIVGLGVGVASAEHRQSSSIGASETVVLGEDASLAPSSLLASGP